MTSLTSGTRLGPYAIDTRLGEGGMGVVWQATDTRLARKVAIKVLPEAFTRDPERLSRFEREAKVLASLNHPGIAALYGLEEQDGTVALVMELVPGEDLAQRLRRGPLPLEEALALATRVAEALEYAHEHGVVHRDLKPANVKLTPEGLPKILDFGLAKAISGDASASRPDATPTALPTMTSAGTAAGLILGTAAYMSPEQARGKPVDRRADLWAFGCLLHEMLTGRRLFDGETVSDTLAAVLRGDIDFAALPGETPVAVRRLLRRCLARDPRDRLRSAGDAVLELREAPEPAGAAAPIKTHGSRLPWLVAGALALALAGMGVREALRRTVPPAPVLRLSALLPSWGSAGKAYQSFAVAPDGSAIVISAPDEAGVQRLWLRELASAEFRALAGTESGFLPFWSPDSKEIAYFAEGKLRRISRAGGRPFTLCNSKDGRGGAWGADGTILFSPGPFSALFKVSAGGGEPTAATVLEKGEESHRFPCFLGSGKQFVYGAEPGQDGRIEIKVASLGDAKGRSLLQGNTVPRYAEPGTLVYTREADVLAQRIELDPVRLVGSPVPLQESPDVAPISSMPPIDLANDGTLVYVRPDLRPTQLAWIGRDGRPLQTLFQIAENPGSPALSHAGDRLAIRVQTRGGASSEVRVVDLARGTSDTITSEEDEEAGFLTWSMDDREVVVALTKAGKREIVLVDHATGARRTVLVQAKDAWAIPRSVSRDGTLLFESLRSGSGYDIFWKNLRTADEPVSYDAIAATIDGAALSHDGRLLAYVGETSGRLAVYVAGFPARGAIRRVSTEGDAGEPVWRNDDRELYFRGLGDGKVYASEVRTSPTLQVGEPQLLFEPKGETRGLLPSPDGQRFLLMRPAGERTLALTVVKNWMATREAKH